MKQLFILSFILFISFQSNSQGCVAIRSNGGACSRIKQDTSHNSNYTLSLSNRYFRSFRHFVGTAEQKERVERGTEVINYNNTFDITLIKKLKNNWSISVSVPIINNHRSSLYEHDGRKRYSTESFGIGDMRIAVYKWLFKNARKGNIQAGLGIKLPTGDYRFQDYFNTNDTTRVLGPVDQSIQLGDGGTGITLELNGFYNITNSLSVFGNFFYLANPREHNGVSTARGRTPSAASIRYGSDVMSVPDQFMIRAGVNYSWKKFNFSAAYRNECIPVNDLIGGSNGFRRPGYAVSIEPGVSYTFNKNLMMNVNVPVAVKRNRTQSVPDKIRTQVTGVYAQGDAAFADYLVNIGLNVNF